MGPSLSSYSDIVAWGDEAVLEILRNTNLEDLLKMPDPEMDSACLLVYTPRMYRSLHRSRLHTSAHIVLAMLCMVFLVSPTFASTLNISSGTPNPYPNYVVAAIMVTFPDNPAKPTIDRSQNPWTKSYLEGVLFSNADSMAALYANASRGVVNITGQVFDNNGSWYTIDRPATLNGMCDWTSFFEDATQAADGDIDFRYFTTIMVFAPQLTCSTGGFAGSVIAPDTGGVRYRAVDVDGTLGITPTTPQHEFGHVLGLGHANSITCNAPAVLNGTNCIEEEYGDRFSVMGVSPRMMHLAAPHQERLGWLSSSEITEVNADGDYTISVYESSGTTPKVLKIPQARDGAGVVTKWYYLEYRRPIGFDNIARTPTIQALGVPYGALVHLGNADASDNYTTTLLDMTPGSLPGQDIFDPALPEGASYTDTSANVSFGILSRTGNDMTIRVRFSSASLCEWKAPTVTAKAIKNSGKRGQELRYDLTVKNNSTLCGKQTVDISTKKMPASWKVTIDKLKKKSISLAPGKSQKVVVRMTSPKNAKFPKYSVQIESKMKAKTAMKKISALQLTVKK